MTVVDREKLRLLDELLLMGAECLDLTETEHADAVAKYGAVGRWLDAWDSPLRVYRPVVFVQGSVAIGTASKAVGREERDIDLVCRMNLPLEISQARAKGMVGDRLRQNRVYAEILEEKNRCWRLNYAGQFHMDILPAKPDHRLPTPTALLVPDKELTSWKESDPEGYAAWFADRATHRRQSAGSLAQARVEPAPVHITASEKAPLQVVVQLLKRHRAELFRGDSDAPISIIITTLAARAYRGQDSIFEALMELAKIMPTFVEYRDGVAYVPNPTNPLENFADKWQREPRKQQMFNWWIEQARRNAESLGAVTLAEMEKPLAKWLGEQVARRVLKRYGERVQDQRTKGLGVVPSTGLLGVNVAGATPVHRNTFYGSGKRRRRG